MPWRFWQNGCCNPGVWQGRREDCACSSSVKVQRSRWMLTAADAKLRYQLHYGLRPTGPHRTLADTLVSAVSRSCSCCEGYGLVEFQDGAKWQICSNCWGFGSLPLPNSPELKAIRAQVAEQHPEAVAPSADQVGPESLGAVLESGAPIVQELNDGVMLSGAE